MRNSSEDSMKYCRKCGYWAVHNVDNCLDCSKKKEIKKLHTDSYRLNKEYRERLRREF